MLDASIPLRVKPAEFENPVNVFAKAQQLELMGQQNALAQLAMQEKRRSIEEDAALNQAYAGAINDKGQIDRPALYSALAQSKLGSKIPATQKIFNEQDKSALEATKIKLENTHKMVTGMGSLMGGVTDQRSYDEARAEGARMFGPEAVAHLPAQYDAQDIARRQKQVMTVAEQITDQWKKLDYDFNLNKFEYEKTNDEKNRGVTIRGQNLQDARSKRSNELKEKELEMGGKPPPGYRWTPDGSLVAIPGGPGDKLSEGQSKQVLGVQNTRDAIAAYRDKLKQFNTADILSPDARATMGTVYYNMLLQAKEANNLGVLNGPDLDILKDIITDPRSVKGALLSKKALERQAEILDQLLERVGKTVSETRPRMKTESVVDFGSLK